MSSKVESRILGVSLLALLIIGTVALSCGQGRAQTSEEKPAAPAPKAATMAAPLTGDEMKPFLQSVIAMSMAQNKQLAAETDEYRKAKAEFQSALEFYNRTVDALRKARDIPATCFPDVQSSSWLQAKPDGSGAMPCVVAAKATKAEKK